MRNCNGIHACQAERRQIERDGYTCAYTNMYTDKACPDEVKAAGGNGWDVRRAIKNWAASEGIADYRIFRATDYVKDLHGVVYEVFVRNPTP